MLLLLDYYTTRKVSFFHATFTTVSLLSLHQILFLFWLSLSNTGHYQHSFTTNNAASLAEHIPSASFKAVTPGGSWGLCSLKSSTEDLFIKQSVTRTPGINYCICLTGTIYLLKQFYATDNFMLIPLAYTLILKAIFILMFLFRRAWMLF